MRRLRTACGPVPATALAIALAWGSISTALHAADSWPEFRGPNQDGSVEVEQLPLQWGETINVKWKTAIHGEGWSTPVVHGNQVWLTTATKDGKKMSAICVDRSNGQVLFDKVLFTPDQVEPLGNPVNRYASPSPTIEDGFVYIHFGSYGTTCIDTKTFKTVWSRTDLPCQHYRGPGSSVVLFEGKLILTMDGVDVQYIIALDKKTGKKVWRTDRSTDYQDLVNGVPRANGDYRKAYSTPLIVETKQGTQMIVPGAKATQSYDPRTGKELWQVNYKGFSNAARAVWADGIAVLNTGYGKPDLIGVKTDGKGDVTDSHVLWRNKRSIPKRSSPVLVDGLIYTNDDNGIAQCMELKTGDQVWATRLGGQYSASPIYVKVGDEQRIYFFSEQGKTTVIRPGRKFDPIGKATLDSGFMASPAVAGNALYLRTKTHLYRIEN